jgi:hypothetical protein
MLSFVFLAACTPPYINFYNLDQKLRFLAKTKGQSISISITYILFLTKMQKRQTLEKEFALFKNDITTN